MLRLTSMWLLLIPVLQVTAQPGAELQFYQLKSDDTFAISSLITRGEQLAKEQPNSTKAIQLFLEARQRCKNLGYTDGLVRALFHAGRSYKDQGFYDQGINSFGEALRYVDRVSDPGMKGKLYNGLGTCYFMKADYKQAAFYYFNVLEEIKSKRLTEPYHVAQLYSNFGYLWMQLGDSTQALYCLRQAESLATTYRINDILANVYINLGNYYDQFGNDLGRVHHYFNAALKTAQENNNLGAQQIAIHNMGSILLNQGKADKAIPYFKSALGLRSNTDPYSSMIGEHYALGAAYYTIRDYDNAEKNVLIALKKSQETGLRNFIAKAYELLYLIYADKKQYERAFEYATRYISINDSIINAEKSKGIRDMEIKYHTSEKDKVIIQKQLLISKQENYLKQKNNWIMLISAGSLLLIILLVSLYRISRNRRNLQEKQIRILTQEQELLHQEQHLLKQEQEIERLKAMMQGEEKERTRIARELHDGIGGMLVAIRMNLGVVRKEYKDLAGMDKLDEIESMVNDTSSEVRKTAHNLMPDILAKHSLSEALIIYCENINTPNQLEVELQFHGNIDQLSKGVELILYRIVQELIQNIIKHANATYAVIQIVQNEKLSIFVEDNGTGFDTSEASNGYGLENLKARVMTLQGELAVASEKGKNTTVYIEFELEKLKNNKVL